MAKAITRSRMLFIANKSWLVYELCAYNRGSGALAGKHWLCCMYEGRLYRWLILKPSLRPLILSTEQTSNWSAECDGSAAAGRHSSCPEAWTVHACASQQLITDS